MGLVRGDDLDEGAAELTEELGEATDSGGGGEGALG